MNNPKNKILSMFFFHKNYYIDNFFSRRYYLNFNMKDDELQYQNYSKYLLVNTEKPVDWP